jgi:hypothetical protein
MNSSVLLKSPFSPANQAARRVISSVSFDAFGWRSMQGAFMNSATLIYPSTEVVSLLRQSPIPDLRALEVEESEFEVVITGLVGSYYLKQLAQETVRPAVADRRLRNRVVVAHQS